MVWPGCNRGRKWTRLSPAQRVAAARSESEEHTSELQSRLHRVCRLVLEKKKSWLMFGPGHGCAVSCFLGASLLKEAGTANWEPLTGTFTSIFSMVMLCSGLGSSWGPEAA